MKTKEKTRYLKKAQYYHTQGELEKAVTFYARAALYANQNYDILSKMAKCLSLQGKFKQSLDIHLFLALKYPKRHQGDGFYILKNKLRTHINRTQDLDLCQYSINILEKISSLLENKTKAYYILSDLYWCNNQKDKALEVKSIAANEWAIREKKSQGKVSYPKSEPSKKLPDFLVLGAQKTGTTALYSYIVEHPDIYPSIIKEIFYFNTDLYTNGIDWYKSHFPMFDSQNYLTGEATAKYFNSGVAAKRIAKDLPDSKFIFIVRNPAERAISDYYMKVRNGMEKRTIEQAILSEIDFLKNTENVSYVNPGKRYSSKHNGYVLYGMYYFFLKKYLDRLSREKLIIIDSSDLRSNHQETLSKIFYFLGVSSLESKQRSKKVNVGSYSKESESYTKINRELTDFYKPYNSMLEELTGMKFSWE